MTDTLATLARIWLPLVGAAVAHEATHALPAALLGLRPRLGLDGWRPVVTYDRPDRTRTAVAINLAPTAVGLVAGVAWVVSHGWPAATPFAFVGVVAWGIYVGPSLLDLLDPFEATLPEVDEPLRRTLVSTAFIVGGLVAHQLQWVVLDGPVVAISQATIGASVGGFAALWITLAEASASEARSA